MDIHRAGIPGTAEAVQTPQALRKGAHTARFRDQQLGVDIGTDLQSLRGHHDQMASGGVPLDRGTLPFHGPGQEYVP